MHARASIRGSVVATILAALVSTGCGESPEALVASAKQYIARNDLQAATIQLKNALQSQPDLAEARFLLGMALFQTGDLPGAEKELRRARDLRYPAGEVNPVLATTLVQLGQFNKVVDEFGDQKGDSPRATAQIATAVGEANMNLGRAEAAHRAFAGAIAADPRHAPALVGEGRLKAQALDLDGATKQVNAAIEIDPKLADAWLLRGEIQQFRRDFAAATTDFRKAVEVGPRFIPAHAALVSILARQGKKEDAAAALAAMKQVAPRDPRTSYFTALVRARDGDFKGAREAIQEQLRVMPNNLAGMLLAGAIDYELRDYAQAEANLLKVLQVAPDQLYARQVLIATYTQTGQTSKALEVLKPVVTRLDGDAAMLNLAAEVYMRAGDPASAARYFEKAAAVDPKATRPRTGLGLLHLAQGDTERGFRELEAAAVDAKDARADLVLIATAMRQRQFDKALGAIDKLEKKQPGQPIAANLRGLALAGKGDRAAARRAFDRAVELKADYFPAVANLAQLDVGEKKSAEARKRFEAFLGKHPGHADALLALAGLRAREKAPADEIAGLMVKAVSANPTALAPRLELISQYLRMKEPKRAVAAAQEAQSALPGRPEILEALAVAQNAAGDVNQAITTINRWIEAAPNTPQPYLRLAELQTMQKDYDGAVQSLRKALAIRPDLLAAQRGLAALDLRSEKIPQALAIAKEVQKQRPNDASGYVLESDIHASRRRWPEAIAALRTALSKQKTTEVATKLLVSLNASGQRPEAERFAASWLKEFPGDARFRFYVAQLESAAGNHAVAGKHYEVLLAAEPENAAVLNNLAWTSYKLHDARALEFAEKANRLAPNQPAMMDTLGVLLLDKGEVPRALELLKKAVELEPGAASVRLNLARALIKAGDKSAARTQLDELSRLGDRFAGHAEVARLKASL